MSPRKRINGSFLFTIVIFTLLFSIYNNILMNSKKQKKVLQIITKSNFGGAQKYVYELSKKMKSDGYNIVAAFGGDGPLKEKLQNEDVRTIEIESLHRDINIFSDFKVFWKIIKIIKKEKPDVVHLNSSKVGAIGSIAARFCFTPRIIFTIHGLAFNEDRGIISKNIIKLINHIAIFYSHKSIAVSENVKKNILEIPLSFIIKNKVIVIKNGIDEIDFIQRNESRDFISNKIGQNIDNKKIIGTIAELHQIKGINYLIDAAKIITKKELELIFVVFGEGDERKELEKHINENNLNDHFYLLGFVDNAPKYLKGVDLFVLPSLYEALALVILEAKQAGIKIAASNTGGIPEAISNYKKVTLFEPKNVDDMSEKICSIIKKDFELSNETNSDDSLDTMYRKTIEAYSK